MKLYSRIEAAALLGVGLTTLDKLRKEGKLSYYQATPGGKVQFARAHLEAYLERAERVARKAYKGRNLKL